MLTPVDVHNKSFKGGIGFDKKDVENFMRELSTDYEQLYRSNVELNDKVSTLNESLQHYRATEDSMQKALTISEKTAEETVNAANDKARLIVNEATKKAEVLLEDAKKELQDTKEEIFRLKQLHDRYKEQYEKVLQGQLELLKQKLIEVNLGDYESVGFGEMGYSLGDEGYGSLGGGYTGAGSFDNRFERTNQDPAFDRGTLNMDPFADAANGGGRFSRQTGKGFTQNSKNGTKKADGEKSGLNVKNAKKTSTRVKRDFTNAANVVNSTTATQQAATSSPVQSVASDAVTPEEKVVTETVATAQTQASTTQATVNSAPVQENVTAQQSESVKENAAVQQTIPVSESVAPEQTSFTQDVTSTTQEAERVQESFTSSQNDFDSAAVSGEVEQQLADNTLIGNDDDDDEGFNFMEADEPASYSNSEDVVSGEIETPIDESSLLGNDDDDDAGFEFSNDFEENQYDEDLVSGEVEIPVNESTMLENSDDDNAGFEFMDDFVNETTADDDFDSEEAIVGEVEDRNMESTMLDSEDNYSDGFDFVVGNENEEEDIPTISSFGESFSINFNTPEEKMQEEDVFAGDVEDPVLQSNMIGNEDDLEEGFNFL